MPSPKLIKLKKIYAPREASPPTSGAGAVASAADPPNAEAASIVDIARDDSGDDMDVDVDESESAGLTATAAAQDADHPAVVDDFDAHFLAHIKRDPYLLVHRAVYFFGMGANAAYYPFAVQLWASEAGANLNMGDAGAVYAAGHMAAMVAAPVLSAIADRSEASRRAVLVGGFAAQALAIGSMSLAHSFWTVLVIQMFVEASGSAIWTGMDAATQRLLTVVRGSTSEYGNTRAWGAAGWGLFALICGAIFDRYGLRNGFWLFGVVSIPAAACALHMPLEKRASSSQGRAHAFRALLRPSVLLVLAVVLVTAVLLQIVDVFRFPFLASIGASNALLGGSLTVTAMSEAPFFFITSAVLARISLKFALCIVLFGYAIRFLYYAQIGMPPLEAPEWTLPAELLHGFTFALGWAAATQYVAVLLPPELSSSAQGLLAAVQWGLGSAVGSSVGGAVARKFGWRAMWRSGAALAAITLVVFWLSGKESVDSNANETEESARSLPNEGGARGEVKANTTRPAA